MNVLITGAGGKIGKKLLQKLQDEPKLRISVLTKENGIANGKFGDLLDPQGLIEVCKGIDRVVHLAGLTHSDSKSEYYATNLDGTINLLQACEINGIKRFVFISSQSASPHGGAYAHSKFLAERAVINSKMDWVILRLSEVYGTGTKDTITELINRIKMKRIIPIPGFRNMYLQPAFVDDVVNGLIKAIKSDINKRIYLLAGPETFTYRNFVRTVSREFEKKVFLLPVPLFLISLILLMQSPFRAPSVTQDQIQRLAVTKPRDIKAAQKDLSYAPIKIRQYLKSLN